MNILLILGLVLVAVFFLVVLVAVAQGMTSKKRSGHLPGGRKANRSRK